MKICYILTEIANGGAERVVLNLCKYFSAQGDEISLIALKPSKSQNPMYKEFAALDIKIYSLGLNKWNIFNLFKLTSVINQIRPDIIHSHLFHGNILSRLLKRNKKSCRLVNTIHIMEYRKSAFWRFKLDEITFNLCDVHTAVAKSTANFQAKKLNMAVESFKVIPNGIDLPKKLTAEQTAFYRKKFQLDKFNKVFGCVGRLDYQKGFDRLLALLPEISKIVPKGEKYACLIIGDGTERENLEKLSKKYQVSNIEVIFAGFYAEASSMIGLFDCFIMPSRSEGYPLVLLEAMSHGVPMLLNNVSCIIEALNSYSNAEVVDFYAGSEAEIVEKLSHQLTKMPIEYSNITSVAEMAENYKKMAYLQ